METVERKLISFNEADFNKEVSNIRRFIPDLKNINHQLIICKIDPSRIDDLKHLLEDPRMVLLEFLPDDVKKIARHVVIKHFLWPPDFHNAISMIGSLRIEWFGTHGKGWYAILKYASYFKLESNGDVIVRPEKLDALKKTYSRFEGDPVPPEPISWRA